MLGTYQADMLKHSPREKDVPKHQGQSCVMHPPLPLPAGAVQEKGVRYCAQMAHCPPSPEATPKDPEELAKSRTCRPRDTIPRPASGPSRAASQGLFCCQLKGAKSDIDISLVLCPSCGSSYSGYLQRPDSRRGRRIGEKAAQTVYGP